MMKWSVIAFALVAGLLAGCAPATPAALPDGVTVALFQNRFDYSLRQIEMKVANGSDLPLTITRASLESNRFAQPAVWDRPQLIPSGSARDLKALLGDPVCEEGELTLAVTLDFTLADGATGSATVTPTDPTGRVEVNNGWDCLGVSVSERATITAPDSAPWMPGAHGPATLDLTVEPTGGTGTLTIHQAKGTVLLGLVDETGAPITVQPIDLEVSATSAPAVIRLLVAPTRCDPHAVAEDKRGTFFPLDVSTDDGRLGTIYVGVSDEVRASLYDFFGDFCDLP